MSILDHVLVPVASEDDAIATSEALRPHVEGIERVTALHVIEKGGGTVDKAPVAKRREDAAAFLAVVDSRLSSEVAVDTRTAFGTSVVETIFDEAQAVGAAAVAIRPRGGSRIVQLLTGDTANRLVTEPRIPVVSLPVGEGDP